MAMDDQKYPNHFFVQGVIEDIDQRGSGAAAINLRTSSRDESAIRGAPIPSFFTPVLFIRFPERIVSRVGAGVLEVGNVVTVEGRMQGIRRVLDGRSFYLVELTGTRMILLSRATEGLSVEHLDQPAPPSEKAPAPMIDPAPERQPPQKVVPMRPATRADQ